MKRSVEIVANNIIGPDKTIIFIKKRKFNFFFLCFKLKTESNKAESPFRLPTLLLKNWGQLTLLSELNR
ncbi:hypothetical protein [Candidatus Phytoplasma pruni]|uniref:hypothetical protein n=1 Tax=Candidatus Phytoplasma pruni TaxID=479893 RepID=UPI001F1A62CA|nr:hypothetical protein [Candidatus Phytoplasma pruni]